jgi:hypothetical protein
MRKSNNGEFRNRGGGFGISLILVSLNRAVQSNSDVVDSDNTTGGD